METNKEKQDALIDWFEMKALEIRTDAVESIDSVAEHAIKKLSMSIKSLRKQAKVLDSLLPMNLIEILARGGFVNSEDRDIGEGYSFSAQAGTQLLFYDQMSLGRFKLKEGKYRFTFIVEKLSEEE